MLLSKATYNWGIYKAINLEEANKLAREGEKDKEKDEDFWKRESIIIIIIYIYSALH